MHQNNQQNRSRRNTSGIARRPAGKDGFKRKDSSFEDKKNPKSTERKYKDYRDDRQDKKKSYGKTTVRREESKEWKKDDRVPARKDGYSKEWKKDDRVPARKDGYSKEWKKDDKRPVGKKEYSREGKRDDKKPIGKKTYNSDKKNYSKDKSKYGKVKKDEGLIRLNKYIANSGICSRREADQFIQAGLVSVNGKIVVELGSKVESGDDIRYNGERIIPERKVYLLLNKPKDYVTTMDDPHAKRTVMELVDGACKERVYPVGRLDRNTTGLLLFTNDGDLAKKLTHPSHGQKKVYHVYLDKNLKQSHSDEVLAGVTLDDETVAKADKIEFVDADDKSQVGLEIHTGENRVVRRMFEALGYKVVKLDRVFYAGLTKKNLKRGQWRFLTEKEIVMLKMQSGLKVSQK